MLTQRGEKFVPEQKGSDKRKIIHVREDTNWNLPNKKMLWTQLVGIQLTLYWPSLFLTVVAQHAHKMYKAALEETKEKEREKKRKREQIEAERQMEEKKEQERLEKVKGLEKQNKEIDSKMNEIEYTLKGIDSLISEANDHMGKAIKS